MPETPRRTTQDFETEISKLKTENSTLRASRDEMEKDKKRQIDEFESAAVVPIMNLQRFGTPARVIGAKCLLCNEEAKTGQVLVHDHGCILKKLDAAIIGETK